MLIAQMNGVKKYYGDRLVLRADDFKIYDGDRIGVVGVNGCGKTTFLNILTGTIASDEGISETFGPYAYIKQLDVEDGGCINNYASGRFGVCGLQSEGLSGGEITRIKIAKALGGDNVLIIGDEPTSNLDAEGIELLQDELKKFRGALLIVSHDREFLDEVCSSILEIENGEVHLYSGNYSKYKDLKDEERNRAAFEYEQYVAEKNRLESAAEQKVKQAGAVRKTPRRMGNSEARLHKMGGQSAKASLERQANAIRTRIEKLDVKEKPKELPKANVDLQDAERLHCKVVFSSDGLDKSFDNKIIFKHAKFVIMNNSKTAIIGPNGSGKTTLIKMIIGGEPAISRASGVKIGYFSQDISILDDNRTLLENVMEDSRYDETFVRILLLRLLFKKDDVHKSASMLSGGERVKAALAKIIVSGSNVLILDEPTNYLDIFSVEAVEEALLNYEGTVVFVSHDRRFVNNVADHIILLKDKGLVCFDGTFEEYKRKKQTPSPKSNNAAEKMVLKNRLAEIIGRLSMPSKDDDVEALDREYKQTLQQLKQME